MQLVSKYQGWKREPKQKKRPAKEESEGEITDSEAEAEADDPGPYASRLGPNKCLPDWACRICGRLDHWGNECPTLKDPNAPPSNRKLKREAWSHWLKQQKAALHHWWSNGSYAGSTSCSRSTSTRSSRRSASSSHEYWLAHDMTSHVYQDDRSSWYEVRRCTRTARQEEYDDERTPSQRSSSSSSGWYGHHTYDGQWRSGPYV